MNIPLNIDWQQILLHMFNFVLLFAILYFLLYKPGKKFIAKRAEYYANMDKEAQSKLENAAAAEKAGNERLAQVDAEIAEKRRIAVEQFAADKERYLNAAQAESDRIMNKAKAEAQSIRDEMLRKTNEEIQEIVTAAAEKIVFPDADAAYDRFLEEAEGSDRNE